jgi:hypothetical protein
VSSQVQSLMKEAQVIVTQLITEGGEGDAGLSLSACFKSYQEIQQKQTRNEDKVKTNRNTIKDTEIKQQ